MTGCTAATGLVFVDKPAQNRKSLGDLMRRPLLCLFFLVTTLTALVPTGQVSAQLFIPESESITTLVDDATRLDQTSASTRFSALLALLDERDLAYEIQTFRNHRAEETAPVDGRNVSVTIGSGEREIIVGAHADAARLRDGSLSHAMIDNAAAVAVLVRVAKTLQQYKLRHRVRVMFFDLEELNLLGSRHFVKTVYRNSITGMINLDIVGYGDTLIYGPATNAGNEELYATIRQTCAHTATHCLEFPQFPPSDDRSFQDAGIPNISLATLPRLEAHQLWLMLNSGSASSGLDSNFVPAILQTIHTPGDTIEKLDPAGMTLAYNIVMGAVLELDRIAR